jgi:hypothetical protein
MSNTERNIGFGAADGGGAFLHRDGDGLERRPAVEVEVAHVAFVERLEPADQEREVVGQDRGFGSREPAERAACRDVVQKAESDADAGSRPGGEGFLVIALALVAFGVEELQHDRMDVRDGEEEPFQELAAVGGIGCGRQRLVAVGEPQEDGGGFEHRAVGRFKSGHETQRLKRAVGGAFWVTGLLADQTGFVGLAKLLEHEADGQRRRVVTGVKNVHGQAPCWVPLSGLGLRRASTNPTI